MILPDYLQDGLSVVFCGTAAGKRSADRGHFFSDPGNSFWRILHKTGLTPVLLTPQQDGRVLAYGIGLTDLVKHFSGNDKVLRREMFDVTAFTRKLHEYRPRFVAFNGKAAARAYLGYRRTADVKYGPLEATVGVTKFFALPSTSGLARNSWDEQPWHELAALIHSRERA